MSEAIRMIEAKIVDLTEKAAKAQEFADNSRAAAETRQTEANIYYNSINELEQSKYDLQQAAKRREEFAKADAFAKSQKGKQ